jgi:hypothetical protein
MKRPQNYEKLNAENGLVITKLNFSFAPQFIDPKSQNLTQRKWRIIPVK